MPSAIRGMPMNVLYLSPQPFYIERGSPIAIKLMLGVWDQRGDKIDVITYHEGRDIAYEHVDLYRIPRVPFLRQIPPGFSAKKLACDFLMIGTIIRRLASRRYDVVHAVEEGVFFALLIKLFLRVPYVYDMDSSLADQLIEKHSSLRALQRLLRWCEGVAVRHATAVVPVCDALAERAELHGAQRITVLYDVPMRDEDSHSAEDLRSLVGGDGVLALYVGNLEAYQGIDLLIESVALLGPDEGPDQLVLIGGESDHVAAYRRKADRLGLSSRVHFLGPRPVQDIYGYLEQADILVSPRTKGYNTPMKIYSYLASGRPVVATRLWTHTQVLDDQTSVLPEPEPSAFADALRRLADDATLRQRLGEAGRKLIDSRYSYSVYVRTLNEHLDWLQDRLVSTPLHAHISRSGPLQS